MAPGAERGPHARQWARQDLGGPRPTGLDHYPRLRSPSPEQPRTVPVLGVGGGWACSSPVPMSPSASATPSVYTRNLAVEDTQLPHAPPRSTSYDGDAVRLVTCVALGRGPLRGCLAHGPAGHSRAVKPRDHRATAVGHNRHRRATPSRWQLQACHSPPPRSRAHPAGPWHRSGPAQGAAGAAGGLLHCPSTSDTHGYLLSAAPTNRTDNGFIGVTPVMDQTGGRDLEESGKLGSWARVRGGQPAMPPGGRMLNT